VVLAHLWAEDLWQQFNNVRYAETQLRIQIQGLFNSNGFWCYESYLHQQRGASFQWWEWGVPLLALVVLVVLIIDRQVEKQYPARSADADGGVTLAGWTKNLRFAIEWSGYLVCTFLVITLFFKVSQAVQLRLAMVGDNTCGALIMR